ncbi:MAG: hypothetical protein JOZ99_04700, partial [Actinobacteria bacterium]|nr:hypothetical protein [Actinomycetota bacterium]
KGAPIAATQSAGLSTGGPDIEIDLVRAEAADRAASTGPAVMTRRERRLASRRRFALGHRRSQRVM